MDLVETIDANIRAFLEDKPLKMDFNLESAERDWPTFLGKITAEGDLEASLAEWRIFHNAMPPRKSFLKRAVRKAIRLPQELRH